jgi:hypothetical protein
MDEFNFDIDNEIGTSINQLKKQNISDKIQFDYDKLQEHFNSEQLKETSSKNNEYDINNINKIKKQKNINTFIKELEYNLDNFDHINLNEPLPVNFTKAMIPKKDIVSNTKQEIIAPTIQKKTTSEVINNLKSTIIDFNYREILILMLLFMVLNNKVIIELIYTRVPYMNNYNSPYPNLIVRTLLFGIILFLIKKFLFR